MHVDPDMISIFIFTMVQGLTFVANKLHCLKVYKENQACQGLSHLSQKTQAFSVIQQQLPMYKLSLYVPQSWEGAPLGLHHSEGPIIAGPKFIVFQAMWIIHVLYNKRCPCLCVNLSKGMLEALLEDGIIWRQSLQGDQVFACFQRNYVSMF